MVNRYSREGIHSSSSSFLMLLPRWTDAACTHAGNPNSVRCFLRSSLTIPGTRIEVLPFFLLSLFLPFHFFIPFPRMNEEMVAQGFLSLSLSLSRASSDKGITHFANFFIANFSPWGPSISLGRAAAIFKSAVQRRVLEVRKEGHAAGGG